MGNYHLLCVSVLDSCSRHLTSVNKRLNGQLWGKAAVVQALFQIFICLLSNLPNVPKGYVLFLALSCDKQGH